jgi:hypothetical protein
MVGHGTRVESQTSFGKVENPSGRPHMPQYNIFFFCYVTDIAVCDVVLVCTELFLTVALN